MAKIYNKIVESTTEPSKEDLWLKEGKIKKFKNGWEDVSGKSDVKIPTKVSELENDSGFVENTSLGTAAYKNVEDLKGGTLMTRRTIVNGGGYNNTEISQIDLSAYNTSMLKVGAIFNVELAESNRNVHFIDGNGVLLGTISGINARDTNIANMGDSPHATKIYAMYTKITSNIYKIEINSGIQSIITYSDSPISYIMAGVYTDVLPSITEIGGVIISDLCIEIYA